MLAALVALTTGCDFITGIPTVTRVDVSVAPTSLSVGTTGVANATVYGKSDKILRSSKINVGYASSNPAVASINSSTGQIVAVGEGTAEISATARSKEGRATITVLREIPSQILVTQPNLEIGQTVTLDIRPLNASGQVLTGRRPTVTSNNTGVLTVSGSGTATPSVTGVTAGVAALTVDIDGRTTVLNVTVTPPRPSSARLGLSKGTNTLQVGESNQAALQLFNGSGGVISNIGQAITYITDDQSVAVVNASSGLVTGINPGSTTIRATVGGTTVGAAFTLTVVQVPARIVQIANRAPFLRLGSDGTGVPSTRGALAFDSAGRQLVGRTVTYTSTDPSIFTVNALGVVTARRIGSARLVASADNGGAADTLTLRVTEVPIVAAQITPTQSTVTQGATIQFTAVLTDSLGVAATSSNVQWLTSNPLVLQINSSGLATAIAPGNAQVTLQVPQVTGLPATIQAAPAAVTVLPTSVATLEVVPDPVTVKVGASAPFSVTPRDAAGLALTGRAVTVRITDPTIATVNLNSSGNGVVGGLKAGSTTIVFQALDISGNPQGAPTTITVTVTP